MNNTKSPLNIMVGLILILLSILMVYFFFGREDSFFTNTRAGSAIGIGAACAIVLLVGISRVVSYFWSLLPKADERTKLNLK